MTRTHKAINKGESSRRGLKHRRRERKRQLIEIPNGFVNLTDTDIPEQVKAILSYGPKFGKGASKWEEGTYDDIISTLIYTKHGEWADEVEIMNIKDSIRELQGYLKQSKPMKTKTEKAERWYKAMKTTSDFVANNPEIHIMEADKGKVTVAINKEDYEQKVNQFVTKGIENKIFEIVNEKYIANRLNAKIRRILKENTRALTMRQANLVELTELIKRKNKMNDEGKGDRTLIENINTRIKQLKEYIQTTLNLKKVMNKVTEKSGLGIPRMYGTVKIHKLDKPIRPIVDTRYSVGGPIAEMLATILKVYKCKDINILNTEDLIQRLETIKLAQEVNIEEEDEEEENILASLDVSDMFTNIPIKATIQHIIRSFGQDIKNNWHLEEEEIRNILTFALTELNLFKVQGVTYRQIGGLAMGSPLAPIMADIYMDHLINKCVVDMKKRGVIAIYKYVDDILIIGKRESIIQAKDILEKEAQEDRKEYNDLGHIKFTTEFEDEYRSLDYLEVTLTRTPEQDIVRNWYKKDIASDRLLNYNSDHPDKMKTEVVKEYIKAKIKITSPICHKSTLKKLNRILRNNDYPIKYIQRLMNKVIEVIIKEDKQQAYHNMVTDVVKSIEDRIPTKMERRLIWNTINEHKSQETKIADTLKRKRKREKVEQLMNTQQKAWACLPYIDKRSDTIKKIIKKRNKGMKVSSYVPNVNRTKFFVCPKDKVPRVMVWNCIATISCPPCKITWITECRGSKPLGECITEKKSLINKHVLNTGHNIKISSLDIKRIKNMGMARTLIIAIETRNRICHPDHKIIILSSKNMAKEIEKSSLHKRLEKEVQKTQEIIAVQPAED